MMFVTYLTLHSRRKKVVPALLERNLFFGYRVNFSWPNMLGTSQPVHLLGTADHR